MLASYKVRLLNFEIAEDVIGEQLGLVVDHLACVYRDVGSRLMADHWHFFCNIHGCFILFVFNVLALSCV